MQAGKHFEAHSFLWRVCSARWGLGDGNGMLLHRSCSRGRKWWITLGIFAVLASVPVQILSHFLTSSSQITGEGLKPQHLCHFLFVVCLCNAWNHWEQVWRPRFHCCVQAVSMLKAPFLSFSNPRILLNPALYAANMSQTVVRGVCLKLKRIHSFEYVRSLGSKSRYQMWKFK